MSKKLVGLLFILGGALAFSGTARPDLVGDNIAGLASGPAIVVLAFGDCANCALQLVNLAEVAEHHSQIKVQLLVPESDPTTQRLANAFRFAPELVADPAGEVVNQMAVQKVPATVLLDAQGLVQGAYEGVLNPEELEQLLTPLAQGEPLPLIIAPSGIGDQAQPLPGLNYAGSRNLLIFHSLTCTFCEAEIPELIKIAAENPELRVWIVPAGEPEQVAEQFAGASENLQVLPLADGASIFPDFAIERA